MRIRVAALDQVVFSGTLPTGQQWMVLRGEAAASIFDSVARAIRFVAADVREGQLTVEIETSLGTEYINL